MKIIDENGVVLTDEPNLDLGYLVLETEIVHHDAVAAIPAKWHREPIGGLYPNGGQDMRRVIDEPAVAAKPAWDETVPVQRYVRYTAEELDEMEAERQRQAERDTLPETVAALKEENEMLRQCLMEMSETVYA